jgi:hypothetical protein
MLYPKKLIIHKQNNIAIWHATSYKLFTMTLVNLCELIWFTCIRFHFYFDFLMCFFLIQFNVISVYARVVGEKQVTSFNCGWELKLA